MAAEAMRKERAKVIVAEVKHKVSSALAAAADVILVNYQWASGLP